MRPLKDLVERARLCAGCHVGSAGREVNHDLIAAGHPRLNFELGLYSSRLPKHWNEQDERDPQKQGHPDFEARLWAIGQVASSQAALDVLAGRARGAADNKKPWPEFAEYGCFGCHHNLKEPSEPRPFSTTNSLPWGTWYNGVLPILANDMGQKTAHAAFQDLEAIMSSPNPDPGRVATRSQAAALVLDTWLKTFQKQHLDAAQTQKLLATLIQEPTGPTISWDAAAQRYLALAAIYHGLTDLDPRQRDSGRAEAIDQLTKSLAFPKGYDSPMRFEPKLFHERIQALRARWGP